MAIVSPKRLLFNLRSALALAASSCVGSAALGCPLSTEEPAENLPARPPDLPAACSAPLEYLVPLKEDLIGSKGFQVAGGFVYFSATANATDTQTGYMGISRVPVGGGLPELVAAPEDLEGFWVEGESVYYSTWEGQLYELPQSGGDPSLVVDALAGAAYGTLISAVEQVLTPARFCVVAFYGANGLFELRCVARGGGQPESLALTGGEQGQRLEHLSAYGDTAIVFYRSNVPFLDSSVLAAPMGGKVTTLQSRLDQSVMLVGASDASLFLSVWPSDYHQPPSDDAPATRSLRLDSDHVYALVDGDSGKMGIARRPRGPVK